MMGTQTDMQIKLLKSVAEEIGIKAFSQYGVNPDSWNWKDETLIDLVGMSRKKILEFRVIVEAGKDVRGTKVMIRDIDTWLKVLDEGAAKARARSPRQFEPLLISLIGGAPGHRVYKRFEEMEDIYLCYYVSRIEYHPEEERNGYRSPAFVDVNIIYEAFGGKKSESIDFYYKDISGKSTLESLASKGFYLETEELRAAYLEQMAQFGKIVKEIGKQYLARGFATDKDMDGNPSGRDSSWYWRATHVYKMDADGNPRRVLIDVFKESEEEEEHERMVHVDHYFWALEENRKLIRQKTKRGREGQGVDEEEIEDLDVDPPEIEIPIHPFVAIFDLKRHLRLKIHVDFLVEYVYDTAIAEKLILPKYLKDLVSMLIEHSAIDFRDIVEGKSGGAVVLLCGPPGTGKTLTAEVYAEAEQKGLYSVQCSQLGTDPEDLEDELLKIFARAQRWGAVMLLDEADVYVRSRGSDLQQNAIVGVFLRVLEYQGSVLFLTTNRPDDVDDAVASRCVARLNYGVPSVEDQARIWRVLAEASAIKLGDGEIQRIVSENKELSGRDVKNLLKLAYMISKSQEIPITLEVIRFVRQFKPTQSNSLGTERFELKGLGGKPKKQRFRRGG